MTVKRPEERTVTVRTYAALEQITVESAYRRLWNGRIPAIKINGRWYITYQEAK